MREGPPEPLSRSLVGPGRHPRTTEETGYGTPSPAAATKHSEQLIPGEDPLTPPTLNI
jgi:hypothetical protein